jgi:hypothetical protein
MRNSGKALQAKKLVEFYISNMDCYLEGTGYNIGAEARRKAKEEYQKYLEQISSATTIYFKKDEVRKIA